MKNDTLAFLLTRVKMDESPGSSLAQRVFDRLGGNVEFADVMEREMGTKLPHELVDAWNKWDVADQAEKVNILGSWLHEIGVSTEDGAIMVLKANRKHRTYDNIAYIKAVIREVVDEEDLPLFAQLLDGEEDIEKVRLELKALLQHAYNMEVQNGQSPDPLAYVDAIGDVRDPLNV